MVKQRMVVKADGLAEDVVASLDSANANVIHTGGCLCGAINYSARSLRPLWYCHCDQCRKMTGHHMAAVQVAYYNITVRGEPKWYYVSDASAHGFCGDCGCQLFWRNDNNDYLSVTAGSLNDTSGLILKGHVFTSEKGGYYNIPKTDLQYSKFWDEDPS
jgi:hypothetical protein